MINNIRPLNAGSGQERKEIVDHYVAPAVVGDKLPIKAMTDRPVGEVMLDEYKALEAVLQKSGGHDVPVSIKSTREGFSYEGRAMLEPASADKMGAIEVSGEHFESYESGRIRERQKRYQTIFIRNEEDGTLTKRIFTGGRGKDGEGNVVSGGYSEYELVLDEKSGEVQYLDGPVKCIINENGTITELPRREWNGIRWV